MSLDKVIITADHVCCCPCCRGTHLAALATSTCSKALATSLVCSRCQVSTSSGGWGDCGGCLLGLNESTNGAVMMGSGCYPESLAAHQHPRARSIECYVWHLGQRMSKRPHMHEPPRGNPSWVPKILANIVHASGGNTVCQGPLAACHPGSQLSDVMTSFADCAGFTEPLTDEQQHQVGLLPWHPIFPIRSALRSSSIQHKTDRCVIGASVFSNRYAAACGGRMQFKRFSAAISVVYVWVRAAAKLPIYIWASRSCIRCFVGLPAGSAVEVTADAGIPGHHVPSSLLILPEPRSCLPVNFRGHAPAPLAEYTLV